MRKRVLMFPSFFLRAAVIDEHCTIKTANKRLWLLRVIKKRKRVVNIIVVLLV